MLGRGDVCRSRSQSLPGISQTATTDAGCLLGMRSASDDIASPYQIKATGRLARHTTQTLIITLHPSQGQDYYLVGGAGELSEFNPKPAPFNHQQGTGGGQQCPMLPAHTLACLTPSAALWGNVTLPRAYPNPTGGGIIGQPEAPIEPG